MLVLSALLLFVVAAYFILAESVFREDKELLVFDTNRTATEQLSSALDGSLRRIADKLEILAQLAAQPAPASRRLADEFFEEDADLLVFQLVRSGKVAQQFLSRAKLQAVGLTEERRSNPTCWTRPRARSASVAGSRWTTARSRATCCI